MILKLILLKGIQKIENILGLENFSLFRKIVQLLTETAVSQKRNTLYTLIVLNVKIIKVLNTMIYIEKMGQKLLRLLMINIFNKKLITCIILALIVLIGVFLRFYQLGVNPP